MRLGRVRGLVGGGGRIKVYNEFVRGTKLMVVEMAVSDLHARIMG